MGYSVDFRPKLDIDAARNLADTADVLASNFETSVAASRKTRISVSC